MILNYGEYSTLGGKLDRREFNREVVKAECEINRRTSGRVGNMANIPEAVKVLCFELIEYPVSSGVVASESIGNWSRSYADKQTQDNAISEMFKTYLSGIKDDTGVPLLYRGLQ